MPVEAGEAKDVRAEKWMEYYQCDQERFWKFQRYFYEWTGEIPKRLELSVKPEKTRYEGTSFAVKAGVVDQKVEVMHPVTKEYYALNSSAASDVYKRQEDRGSGYGRSEISGACFEDYV